MGPTVSTNQLINKYYDLYRENEITFTKDIIRSLKVDLRQIYVKCAGSQWPCIINSTSFQKAKIILGTQGGAYQLITKKDAPPVSVRYCFLDDDSRPMYFFVTAHVTEVTPYAGSSDLAIITLTFVQRPPDDLIMRLGTLLDANFSFLNRKDERISINENSQRLLHLGKKETLIFIQGVPRRCILWDISFSGAKVVIMGIASFLKGKDCVLRFMFSEPDEVVDVKGVAVAANPLEGRKDIVSIGIQYDNDMVPLAYKVRINEYLSTNKKAFLVASNVVQNAQDNQAQNQQKPQTSQQPLQPSQTTQPTAPTMQQNTGARW